MTVCTITADYRLGGHPRYKLAKENDSLMQVPDEVRKCVAFVCYHDGKDIKFAGTVFFINVPTQEIGRSFGYAVTAKHVIVKITQESSDGKVLIRVNRKQGPSTFIVTHTSDWRFHPNDPSIDVAAVPLIPPEDITDHLRIPSEMVVTKETINQEQIGVGDEVFLTGLFVNHYGRERNHPVVRTGNIALMPDEPVYTRDLGAIEAYLIEARSVGGLSGSPVFVHLGTSRLFGNQVKLATGRIFYLLGMMQGHWEAHLPEQQTQSQDALNNEYVNMGIAIVIPISKVMETINQEAFMQKRARVLEALRELREQGLPTADVAGERGKRALGGSLPPHR